MQGGFFSQKQAFRKFSAGLAVVLLLVPTIVVADPALPPVVNLAGGTTPSASQSFADQQARANQIKLEIAIPYVTHRCTPDPSRLIYDGDQCVGTLAEYIAALYKFLISLAGVLALAVIVFAGFGWVMAGGNAEKIKSAQGQITGALMGLFLALFSYTLMQIVNPDLLNLGFVPPTKVDKETQALISDTKIVCPEPNGVSCGNYGVTFKNDGLPGGCMGTMCSPSQICHITADDRNILVSGICESELTHKANASSVPEKLSVATILGGTCGQKTLSGNIGNSCSKWGVSKSYLFLTGAAMITAAGGYSLLGLSGTAAAGTGATITMADATAAAGTTAGQILAEEAAAQAATQAAKTGVWAVAKGTAKWFGGKAATAASYGAAVGVEQYISNLINDNSFCFYVGDYVTGDPTRQVGYYNNSAGKSYKDVDVACPACYYDPENCADGNWVGDWFSKLFQ